MSIKSILSILHKLVFSYFVFVFYLIGSHANFFIICFILFLLFKYRKYVFKSFKVSFFIFLVVSFWASFPLYIQMIPMFLIPYFIYQYIKSYRLKKFLANSSDIQDFF